MEQRTLRVYGFLMNDSGQVLIAVERYKGIPMVKFPGGGVDWGEGHKDALIREFKEELDLTIKVKKMTLELELTEAQQNKLTPVLTKHITERKAQLDKRKKGKGEEKKIEANNRFQIANKILDRKIIFQKEMKTILNEEQFNRFKELQKNREIGMKKKGLKKKKRF